MTLCEDGHPEVCFDGRNCPVCEIIKEKDKEIDALNERIQDLESKE
jgi:hypothetical protein